MRARTDPPTCVPSLSECMQRLELLVGAGGLARLAQARVVVLGLGGVGSACAETLARSAVGELVVLDRDIVAASNINRQVVARTSTLGKAKAEVMQAIIHDINPACRVEAHTSYLATESINEQLAALMPATYFVDAIDTISQKLRIAKWCEVHQVPLISSMGAANRIDPTHLHFADIFDTQTDPLCRVMRKECRKRNITRLEVLYSDEAPIHLDAIDELNGKRPHDKGELLGTMSYMPQIMGHMLASKVIREIVWPTQERPNRGAAGAQPVAGAAELRERPDHKGGQIAGATRPQGRPDE